MSLVYAPTTFKERVTVILDKIQITKMDRSTKEWICAWMQFTGGVALAAYTSNNPTYEILNYVCSAMAVGGAYNYFTIGQANSSRFELRRKRKRLDFACGIITYSTGVYAFSECLQRSEIMCIPCLLLAASGSYLATPYVSCVDRLFNKRLSLKYWQLLLEPTLVASSAIYLFYFRNHSEVWLKSLHFLAIAVSGYKLINLKSFCESFGESEVNSKLLQLKSIETTMGGCLLCIGCTVLAIIYRTTNKFLRIPWIAFMGCMNVRGFVGWYVGICGSSVCIKNYFRDNLLLSIVGVIVGPVTYYPAYLMVKFMEASTKMHLVAFFLRTAGQLILASSLHRFYRNVPLPAFYGYCQRILGLNLAVDGSIVSAYVAYNIGWRFSLLTMPFIPAGMYVAYRGFRKEIRTSVS